MAQARLIQGFRNSAYRTTRLSIADGLSELVDNFCPAGDRGRITIGRIGDSQFYLLALVFPLLGGDEAYIAFPTAKGCWASVQGTRTKLALDRLDGATVDISGRIDLRDKLAVTALEFDPAHLVFELTELEEAILFLTVRYLKAEANCIRTIEYFTGLDFSELPKLRVQNVKELAAYINAHISELPHKEGAQPLKFVQLSTIQRVLSIAGVQKARGRRPNAA